ncbi:MULTISPECIES: hypothetical protein [Moorena]|uniref:hypothetical protein n=1 Tax=Moorena TaxID=1155738 RepID=UPI0010560DBB|nr:MULTISPECIES: hypothetical protein [Moorena]NEP66080.1 hypothetical protein [Moorena sp. SIO3A5]NEQ17575.1 hypothetical protein [Moorena sp. SIO3E2]NER87950.1 hypothetical protein [Moorena sp. SIO3A2]NES41086.1 hypothetical protein [Moorena sp. SIO2C4]
MSLPLVGIRINSIIAVDNISNYSVFASNNIESIFPTTTPYSLLPTPYSLFPTPYSLLPIASSL